MMASTKVNTDHPIPSASGVRADVGIESSTLILRRIPVPVPVNIRARGIIQAKYLRI